MKEYQLETRFIQLVKNIHVDRELLGRSHEFPFNGFTVVFRLPSLHEVVDTANSEYLDAASVATYVHAVDGAQVPRTVNIHRIYAIVRKDQPVNFSDAVLAASDAPEETLTDQDVKTFDEIYLEARSIGGRATAHWLNLLRWRVRNFRIGRPDLMQDTIGVAETYDVETGVRLNLRYPKMTFAPFQSVTLTHWTEAEELLKSESDVPAYISLLQDAEDCFDRGDYRRTLIDLAVSMEVLMRTKVLNALPDTLDRDIRAVIEQANISQYANKWFPNLLDDNEKQLYRKGKLNTALTSLFDARNKIMHMAEEDRATEPECQRFIALAERIALLAENLR